MCGIAGILNTNNRNMLSLDTMKKMLSTIRHRGPDEFGLYKDSHVVLGHARLSIIDLSGGHQPMANEDKTIWITFNGEIFNYLELRQDLLNKGHKLATSSDTEVIIHLFEDHGPDCLKYLNGQFSFAIWDKNKKELFVARDRIGIRPLFYAMEENIFYFSSEIKALFASGGLRREIDPVALDQIFTMWCTIPPQTAFKGINELAPGSYLIIKNGQIYREQYWTWIFQTNRKNYRLMMPGKGSKTCSSMPRASSLELMCQLGHI